MPNDFTSFCIYYFNLYAGVPSSGQPFETTPKMASDLQGGFNSGTQKAAGSQTLMVMSSPLTHSLAGPTSTTVEFGRSRC